MAYLAFVNAGELVTAAGSGGTAEEKLGVIEDGAMLVEEGRVAWVGTTRKLKQKGLGKTKPVDLGGKLVTPGLVDPHTHLVFAGSREDELERKVKGESYTSILAKGGGIVRTVRETRKASTAKIVDESKGRATQLLRNGVTTAEVKTGYGQKLEDELRLLEAIRRTAPVSGLELVPTFLGLHARPPEFKTASEYSAYATRVMLPQVAESKFRPRFSDCFCEEGVFSRDDCARFLRASELLGFERKIHADEFKESGGASLAAQTKCVSADHLGRSDPDGVRAMAGAGVTAVLLPGTSLYSGIPYADARRIAESGCEIALGTDLSPNSWIESPQMVMSLACLGMRMTPAEALLGFTANASKAISRPDLGRIKVGAAADFVVHDVPGYRFLPYRVGGSYVNAVYKSGRRVYVAPGD